MPETIHERNARDLMKRLKEGHYAPQEEVAVKRRIVEYFQADKKLSTSEIISELKLFGVWNEGRGWPVKEVSQRSL